MAEPTPRKADRWTATGKRKTAVARVVLKPGSGRIVVNRRELDEYFPVEPLRISLVRPLTLLDVAPKFDVSVNVRGGGLTGQAEAVRHGIARALCRADLAYRPPLKKAGFLTRDARKVERKKYGQPGARRRFQFSKR
jgi:small subunit ribosomal protein S9